MYSSYFFIFLGNYLPFKRQSQTEVLLSGGHLFTPYALANSESPSVYRVTWRA